MGDKSKLKQRNKHTKTRPFTTLCVFFPSLFFSSQLTLIAHCVEISFRTERIDLFWAVQLTCIHFKSVHSSSKKRFKLTFHNNFLWKREIYAGQLWLRDLAIFIANNTKKAALAEVDKNTYREHLYKYIECICIWCSAHSIFMYVFAHLRTCTIIWIRNPLTWQMQNFIHVTLSTWLKFRPK